MIHKRLLVVASSNRKIIRGQSIFIGRYDFKLIVDHQQAFTDHF